MAQTPSRFCPQCGTPVPAGQRFCSNCGSVMDADIGKPTALSSNPNNPGNPHYPGIPDMSTQMPMSATSMPTQEGTATPPPPPPQSFTPAPPRQAVSYSGYSPQNNQNFAQSAPPTIQQPPAYAKPQKDSSKKVLGQIGCGMLVIILAVLAICGVSGYFAVRWIGSQANAVATSTTGNGTGSNGAGGGAPVNTSTPTIAPTSQTMNATVTYASVVLNFTGVKEASSFTDDSNGSSPVLLRINFGERNPTTGTVFLSYGNNFRLILPDGTSVVPGNEQNGGGIDQAVNRTNWIDFPLSSSMDISKLILRIGAPSEAQMDLPLTANPNVSKYQDKTITPNSAFQYESLNWTLTSVTSSLSAHGKQATTGNRYITVAFKIDNPTANDIFLSPDTYMRLQEGGVVNPPDSYSDSLGGSVAHGTTGTTGTVTFLMPQNSSAFTLTMLARTDMTPPAPQVTQTFQI